MGRGTNSFSLLKGYIKRHRGRLAVGLASLVAVDGIQIFIPWNVRRAIDILTSDQPDMHRVLVIGGIILALAAGIGVTRFVWSYCIIGISRKIEEDLRNRFYRHLQSLSFSYFDKTPVGDLMAHATNDIEAVRMMCGMALVASTDAALLMVASLVMMFSINVGLTFYVLAPLPVVTITILKLGPKLHRRFREVQAGFSRLTQKAQETFSGIRVVKSFVQEDAEAENFRKLNDAYLRQNMRLVKIWGFIHPMIWMVSGFCSLIILLIGGKRVIGGAMSVGDFVAFNSYLGLLVWPMIAIGWVVNLYQRGKASLDRLYRIFQTKPGITDGTNAVDKPLEGRIEFRNLTFGYNGKPVLKNINLTVNPGEWLAVMGRTGSAKSTLVQLIPRLYDPPPGALFIDGIDVRSWKIDSLRRQIGFIPQTAFLFSETVENNIRFGLDIEFERVKQLAEIACIHKDIERFPGGFDTLVGERGVSLSGGQKQRITIARAIATGNPVIIMDDALSAVDTETEETIMSELENLAKNKTLIMVTHRVSAARRAHRIVFLEDGAIVEEGAHDQLISLRGRYFEIYERQKILEAFEREYGQESAATAGRSE